MSTGIHAKEHHSAKDELQCAVRITHGDWQDTVVAVLYAGMAAVYGTEVWGSSRSTSTRNKCEARVLVWTIQQ
jgi:hypothetical protein